MSDGEARKGRTTGGVPGENRPQTAGRPGFPAPGAGDRQQREAKETVGVTDGRWAAHGHPSKGASAGTPKASSGLPIRPQAGPQSGPLAHQVGASGPSSPPPVVPGGWAPSVDVSLLSPPTGVPLGVPFGPPDGAPVEPPTLPPPHPVLGATLRPALTRQGQAPQPLLGPIGLAALRGEGPSGQGASERRAPRQGDGQPRSPRAQDGQDPGEREQRRPAAAPVPPPAVPSTPSEPPAPASKPSGPSGASTSTSPAPFSAFSPAAPGEGRNVAAEPLAEPVPSASPIPGLGAIPGLGSLPGTVPCPATLSALAKLPFTQPGGRTAPASSDPREQELWFHPHLDPAEQPSEPPTSAVATPEPAASPRDPATMAFPLPTDRPVPVHRADEAGEATGAPGPAGTENRPRSPYRTTGPVPTESPYRLVTESYAPSTDDSYGLRRDYSTPADPGDASEASDGDDWFELPSYARPASGASWTAPPPLSARGASEAPEDRERPAPSFEMPTAFGTPRASRPPVVFGAPPPVAEAPWHSTPQAPQPAPSGPPSLSSPPGAVPPAASRSAVPPTSAGPQPRSPMAPPPPVGPPPIAPPPIAQPSQPASAPPIPPAPIPPAPIPPAPAVPENPEGGARPRAEHRAASSPEVSSRTGAIPVIRPPVQVRRPDDEEAATAETRSLRVTPPDAKALFTTPTPAKAPESGAPDATPIGLPPAKANITPPAPAPAPPRPVAPKTAAPVEAQDEDPDPGKTRRVVVRGDLGSAGWVPAEGAKLPGVTQPSDTEEAPAPHPGGHRPEPDPAMANWLGELREGGIREGGPAVPARDGGPSAPTGAVPSATPVPPWGGGERGLEAAQAAATIVPSRGRGGRKQRKAENKDAKRGDARGGKHPDKQADQHGADPVDTLAEPSVQDGAADRSGRKKRFGRSARGSHAESEAPFVLPAPAAADQERYEEDLDGPERGRLLSLIVFWAPALILLILAGVVIWLVR